MARDFAPTIVLVAAGFDADHVDEVVVPTGRILQTGRHAQTGNLWLLTAQRT